jgi:hypothetical protein
MPSKKKSYCGQRFFKCPNLQNNQAEIPRQHNHTMSTKSLSNIVPIALALFLATTSGWNCREDIEEFRPFPPSMEGVDSILRNAARPESKTDFLKSGGVPDTMIMTKNGIRVALKDTEKLFMDDNGKLVPCSTCKSFSFEMTEVAKRGDAIGRGINTLTTNGKMLESNGILFLEAICDGKKLRLKGGQSLQIQVPIKDAQSNNLENFISYEGVVKEKIFVGWETTNEKAIPSKWAVTTAGNPTEMIGLELRTKKLDWIMFSRPIEASVQSLTVQTPQGFNDRNTQVYVVLKDKKAFAKLEYEEGRKIFVHKQMPVNQAATIVAIGRFGTKSLFNSLALDNKADFTVPFKIVPKEAAEQQILDFLNSL